MQAWLNSREDRNTVVEVSDPQIIRKYFGRKAVEFSVTTPSSTVKRRFKDFAALHDGLVTRYPGAVVPPLPPLPTRGKHTPKNVTKRRLALQFFLRNVLVHPYLSADDLVTEFLSSTLKFDRKQALRPRDKLDKWSESSKHWAHALMSSASPLDPVAAVQLAAAELENMHKALTHLNVTLKGHAAKTLAYSKSLQDVAGAFHASANVEYGLVLHKPADQVAASVLETGQRSFSQQAALVQQSPEDIFQSLGCFLRYERWHVEAHLKAVKQCRQSISRHQRALEAYKAARATPEADSLKQMQLVAMPVPVEGAPPPPDLSKVRTRLQRLRQLAVEAQRDARRDIRGVLTLELARFANGRGPRLQFAFVLMSQSLFDESVAVASMWRALAKGDGAASPLPRVPEPPVLDNADGAEDFQQEATRMLGARRPSTLQVLYPFTKEHKDELNVERGAVLQGVVDEKDPDWMVAKDPATGAVGLVPRSYVKVLDDVPQRQAANGGGGGGGREDEEDDDDDEDSGLAEAPPPNNPFRPAATAENPFATAAAAERAPPPPPSAAAVVSVVSGKPMPPPGKPGSFSSIKARPEDGGLINASGKRKPAFENGGLPAAKKKDATDL